MDGIAVISDEFVFGDEDDPNGMSLIVITRGGKSHFSRYVIWVLHFFGSSLKFMCSGFYHFLGSLLCETNL